jgi:chorismate mutase/prephenate dehydratase
MDKNDKELRKIRDRIDALDAAIQDMLNERAACAKEIAAIKRQQGDSESFYRPEREAEILRTIQQRNPGPLSNEEIARLFREIMSACLALEQVLKVAYLGPEGTFTQSAALKHFGHSVDTVSLGSIEDVFREVESAAANYGVVPIENSTEGVITHTLDNFIDSSLKICGEVELRIHHHLLSKQGDAAGLERVYSHHQSLAQCRRWLNANMPGVERVPVNSNAEAAMKAAADERSAAIAGESAADLYGLRIAVSNIEDEPDNTTRFLVIGHEEVQPSGHDKTSLLVSSDNRPGALYRLLKPLAENNISMTRIESRPSRREMWDYVFFVDIEGHIGDEKVAAALHVLRNESSILKILGSYPRAVL